MNREEILKKSKMENKSRDLYEMEVLKDGSNVGAAAAAILATVFFCGAGFCGRWIELRPVRCDLCHTGSDIFCKGT